MSNDSHFRVVYSPPSPPVPASGATAEEESPEARRERRLAGPRRENFGFRSIRQMPGNVFCLKLDSFMDPELAGDTAVSAMNFVSNADALVIDLRENRGGDPRMVQLIASYFLRSAIGLTGLYWRSINTVNQYWTLPHVPGKRMLDMDLYILTSNRTFSAAEAFAYDMKILERATIVGERTAGGANPIGRRQKVNDSFRIDLPIGRAVNPLTQTNWEGVGVEPDIEAPQQDSLLRAHRAALDKILMDAQPERINEVAYEVLHDDGLREAIELFEMNVGKHPGYANGYDSLGEALAMAGDLEAAAAAYRRALELDPGLGSSAEALARIEGGKKGP